MQPPASVCSADRVAVSDRQELTEQQLAHPGGFHRSQLLDRRNASGRSLANFVTVVQRVDQHGHERCIEY
jgi:hypothetical protein